MSTIKNLGFPTNFKIPYYQSLPEINETIEELLKALNVSYQIIISQYEPCKYYSTDLEINEDKCYKVQAILQAVMDSLFNILPEKIIQVILVESFIVQSAIVLDEVDAMENKSEKVTALTVLIRFTLSKLTKDNAKNLEIIDNLYQTLQDIEAGKTTIEIKGD